MTVVVYIGADQVGGGWKTPCFKIGYSEPTRAESREGSSTPHDSVGFDFFRIVLDSDWLTTRVV